MEANKDTPPSVIDQVKEYLETWLKLVKYEAIESSSSFAANFITDVIIFISAVMAFVFATFTLAFFLGDILQGTWRGFGCIALLYIIIVLIVRYNRPKIEKPIINAIIRKFFKEK